MTAKECDQNLKEVLGGLAAQAIRHRANDNMVAAKVLSHTSIMKRLILEVVEAAVPPPYGGTYGHVLDGDDSAWVGRRVGWNDCRQVTLDNAKQLLGEDAA